VETLNAKLFKLSDWLKSNKLSLNVKKCNYILFGHKTVPLCDTELRVVLDNYTLDEVQRTKFLGIIIDSKLTWSSQVQYVSIKIMKGIGIMCKLRNVLPTSALLSLYYTLIYPYLTYCVIIWGCANVTTMHKLVILQKRAIRVVTRSPYRAASNPLFVRLRLLKAHDIYKQQLIIFMFKFIHFHLPVSTGSYFILNSSPVYHRRAENYFIVPSFRTIIREHSISAQGRGCGILFPAKFGVASLSVL